MRSGLWVLVAVTATVVLGYLEIRHQAERERWRAEAARLSSRLEQAERLAEERATALSAMEEGDRERRRQTARLADLEARILDAAAELARLESDRAVAGRRADMAIDELKKQVTALATIETDLTALGQRRRQLERHVDAVETTLQQAEIGAAERQKRSEALDRDIAELAVRRETLLAGVGVAERSLAEVTLARIARESAAVAAPIEAPPARSAPIPELAPAAIAESPADVKGGRRRGLYQFGSLSAAPEAISGGQGGGPVSIADRPETTSDETTATDWAEDQYLLGLRLLSSAERNSGTRELSDAILAFRAVLGEWPKQRDAKRWAIARSDLGYALALLGKRTDDAGVLEQAAAASREALSELERGETPLLWAAAQHHLGVSLDGLADVQDDPELKQASIEALEKAIDAFKQSGAGDDARKVERRLREARDDLPAETAE